MTSGVLVKRCRVPVRPIEASSEVDETSTPQIMRVTVTFLVSATENESCDCTVVRDWATVPGLSDGEQSPQDERELERPRGGTDVSVPPLSTV